MLCVCGNLLPYRPSGIRTVWTASRNRRNHYYPADILISLIGSSIVLPTVAGIINICGTNDIQTAVIGSSENSDTPLWNQCNFVE